MSEEGPSFSLQSVIAKPIIFRPTLQIYYVMTATSEARVIFLNTVQ